MPSRLFVFLIVAFVCFAWVGTILVVPKFYSAPENAGSFGDMFGSINALFSGLAFVGVILAILLQKKELALQREELVATRDELKGQKLQLEEQNKTFRKQSFEGTFFQLLRLHNDIVNAIDMESGSGWEFLNKEKHKEPHIKGRDCFVKLYSILRSWLESKRDKITDNPTDLEIRKAINEIYMELYTQYDSDLGHYFRMLYNLLKFVDTSEVMNKRFYTDLIRAQLSSHELLMIYYNCISDLGTKKLAPLVLKYNLMKHLPEEKLVDKFRPIIVVT